MAKTICSIDGCASVATGRGWCAKHYMRYLRRGDPLATSRIVGDLTARFWSYVDKDGEPFRDLGPCWPWTGHTSPDGYGILIVNRHTVYMPRFSYERVHGPIADGLEPDHLCRNRLCVNPDHLEPVTHRVNILRGESPQAINARKTHCNRGHEYTMENTYITPSTGGRNCRICIGINESNRRSKTRL